ncbi:MAG: hypothetical protein ABI716_01560 [Candidatus Saccharibacteria bacterium]
MNERADEPTHPAEDPFSVFLRESENSVASRSDLERLVEDITQRAQTALDASGYIPLEPGTERYREYYQYTTDFMRQHFMASQAGRSIVDNDGLDKYIDSESKSYLFIKNMKEVAIIAIAKAYVVTAEAAEQISPAFNNDDLVERKRQLIAKMIVLEGLAPDNELITFIDLFVPGGHIMIDDELMNDYYLLEIENITSQTTQEQETEQLMRRAFSEIGIDTTDTQAESSNFRLTITFMVLTSQLTTGGANARANRLERLHETARQENLPADTTARVIEFIEKNFPL